MRNMAFSKTLEQMRSKTKTVTRRWGWNTLQPGTYVRAVEKGMGLKKGEKVVPIGVIRVVSVEQVPIDWLPPEELAAEGFPGLRPVEFKILLGKPPEGRETITRIEFEHVTEKSNG